LDKNLWWIIHDWSEDGDDSEQQVHQVKVKDFYISKKNVIVGQYRKCIDVVVCSKADYYDLGTPHWNDSCQEKNPINCVDWEQA
jgi:formylglycine-generating enzyme required for sulfatase activity